MTEDILFRVLLAILAAVLYTNHHILHRKAPDAAKTAERRPLRGVELWLVITPSLWTLALVLYVTGLPRFDHALPLPQWLRWVGVALMLACLPLSQWIYHELGVHFSKKLELRVDHVLISTGPYRYVRHPMYATLFLCAASTCLISANALVCAATLPVAVVVLLRIRKEEAMLRARFGPQYDHYKKVTGALVPRLLQ